jgi:hypothetical protein
MGKTTHEHDSSVGATTRTRARSRGGEGGGDRGGGPLQGRLVREHGHQHLLLRTACTAAGRWRRAVPATNQPNALDTGSSNDTISFPLTHTQVYTQTPLWLSIPFLQCRCSSKRTTCTKAATGVTTAATSSTATKRARAPRQDRGEVAVDNMKGALPFPSWNSLQ